MEDYGDLFLLENENSPESLFAFQWTYTGDYWGTQNTTQAYFAPEARVTGVGDGWGGGTGVSAWLFQQYEEGDERRKATFMLNQDLYPEILSEEGGYLYDFNTSAIKKYVIGRPEDNDGRVAFMRTGINTYMLRLAEVYLIYAESILGNQQSTSNGEALQYYNAVRERAGLEPRNSITREDLFMEKWKELAYEGQNWFQLVRWHYYDPQGAKQFISDQQRNTSFNYEEGDTTFYAPPTIITANDDDFTLPYPEADISQNPELMMEPVEYDFSQQD